ncbi:GPW/gp25 family protein [Photobacterium leiognathi]|uniref:GPW/gp25 family protein n=1 Tax=Photobacterium leiognathi TaxID=553611 RepID=UPI00020880CF|nr:GPW/gp25 family protein [Photobacterium leiognathi]PSW48334.1 phage baseplate protein [Photobacterium leiognathi subsp. mandapamensis]GAA03231.1 putative phage tail protein [Photobacterium leiognathi subsp. mandapamensis svers.1.1.]
MQGTDENTGRGLTDRDHCKQSIARILTTPINSRVFRRDFGSQLPRLVDAPFNPSTQMDCIAATAEALQRWEPRVDVARISVYESKPGTVFIDLEGLYLPDGKPIRIEGIQIK